MPDLSPEPVARWFDRLFRGDTLNGLSDAQLLERFVAREATADPAFEALRERHRPMVLAVCRRMLRDEHAADDAYQARFLVLVRRAGFIRRRESLGPWLHGVARRVCLRSKAAARLRNEREVRAAVDPDAAGPMIEPPTDKCSAPGRSATEASPCTMRSHTGTESVQGPRSPTNPVP